MGIRLDLSPKVIKDEQLGEGGEQPCKDLPSTTKSPKWALYGDKSFKKLGLYFQEFLFLIFCHPESSPIDSTCYSAFMSLFPAH